MRAKKPKLPFKAKGMKEPKLAGLKDEIAMPKRGGFSLRRGKRKS